MQSLTHTGLTYRTKLLAADQAARFARCLAANPTFTQVATHESTRSAGKFFVSFLPVSPARQQDMLTREQDARTERAHREGSDYLWARDLDGDWHWCLSRSGETYEVTLHSCTCPDYAYRCRAQGLACKHMTALAAGVGQLVQL